MQYSSRLTIAVHMLLCIEEFKNQEKVTSNFLAGSIGVNPVIVRNISGQLKEAGLIHVAAGVGGAMLARDPSDITLYDIFEAVEGKDGDLFHFHENPNPGCPVGRAVHAVLDERLLNVQRAMEDSMRAVTFQSIIDDLKKEQQDSADFF